jgi:beta-glucosidase
MRYSVVERKGAPLARFNRRNFGKLVAALATASVLPGETAHAQPPAQPPDSPPSDRAFPHGFLWGSATASYQVEGAVTEDGRGPSIWDTFSHTPGKTHNGDTGDVATDSYHRYPEDIALMKSLGLTACRFSIAWPRIFPQGTGQPNQKGIDHYRRFAEALRQAGIEPFCTMYHWDLPQALEDKGGWQNKDTAKAFAGYCGYASAKLSDLISNWMTMNEMSSFIGAGYSDGHHAPGLKLGRQAVSQAAHHALLGHGLAVQAIRAATPASAKIGSAENAQAIIPAFNAPEHIAAARIAYVEENATYLTPMHTGRYTEAYLRKLGPDAPKFTPEEMKAIASPTDFQGLNIYTAVPVRAAGNSLGYEVMPRPASYPKMASDWLTIGPEALYWSPKLAAETLNIRKIYITENGCSAADTLAPNGEVYDTDRVMYLTAYLTQLQRAVAEGVPVQGYFLWSLLDNYEWADGYDKRFGITYVDFQTQKRTPKLSSKFYKNLIDRNSL